MKFSMSSRQSAEYLQKADEIKVQWRDRNIIPDLFEKYPNATVNLTRYFQDSVDNEIDWSQINTFHILGQGKFILGLTMTNEMIEAKARQYSFYYLTAVRTFQELNDVASFGVCRVRLGAPLFFQMNKVRRVYQGPIYAVANMASNDSVFEHKEGVCGLWIRPEDVPTYEPYIDVIEFIGNKSQEQALYRIYAEQHKWSGQLNMLVQDLNYPCTNRMIPPTLAETRLNCGHRCQEGGSCRICYRMMDLANPEKISNYLEATKEN